MHIIYARVSTEEQARSGYGIDAQVNACTKRYNSMGISTDIKIIVDDGYSGDFIERPGLDELWPLLSAGQVEDIMMSDPDRMSRNLPVQLLIDDRIQKASVPLYFVTGDYDMSPEGRLFFQMRGAISAYERAKIRERTMSGKRAKANKGKLTFNDRPIGYDYDSSAQNYVINPREAETVKLIFNTYIEHNIGVIELALRLRAMGIVTKKGAWFSGGTLYKLLKNEMYCGTKWAFKNYDKKISQYKKQRVKRDPSEWIAIPVPAIVDHALWEAAQAKMAQNKNFGSRRAKYNYLLRNIIKCGCCCYSMSGMTSVKKSNVYHHYACSSKTVYKRNCSARLIPSDKMDEIVWNQFVAWAKDGKSFTDMVNKPRQDDGMAEKLESYIAELKTRQASVLRLITTGRVGADIAEKDLDIMAKEIAATQSALAAARVDSPLGDNISVDEIINAVTFEQRRDIIIRSGIKIYAKRDHDNNLDWGFSPPQI